VRDFADVKNLFNVSFLTETWHNFALVLDFTAKYNFPCL
jgi:hypothetical protein